MPKLQSSMVSQDNILLDEKLVGTVNQPIQAAYIEPGH